MKKYISKLVALFVCVTLVFAMPLETLATNILPPPQAWEYQNQYEEIDKINDLWVAKSHVYLTTIDLRITDQTPDTMIGSGEDFTIGISVDGVAPLHVVWEVSSDDGKTWKKVQSSDVTPESLAGLTYDIKDAKLNNPELQPYIYHVTVTDDYGHSDDTYIQLLVNDHYHYRHISLRDNPDIEVTGFLHDDTRLVVTPIPDSNATYSAFADELSKDYKDYVPILCDNVKLVNRDDEVVPFYGEILVDFNVGAKYNGQTLPVYYRNPEGNIEKVAEAEVKDGKIQLPFDEMTDFMVGAPVETSYSITAKAGDNGRITSPGKTSVHSGTDKTYIFLPDEGYLIDKVIVDGKEVDIEGNSYTFENIKKNHTIKVSFKEAPKSNRLYNVKGISGKHGKIVVPGNGKVKQGSAQTFYFYPDDGYTIDKVTVNGVEYKVLGHSLTIPAIMEDTTVKVTYRKARNDEQLPDITFPITSSAGDNGSISPEGKNRVEYGGDMYYYFIPDPGYQVDTVIVDGKKIKNPGRFYHFTDVTAPHDIKVTFKKGHAPDEQKFKVIGRAKKHGAINPDTQQTVYEGGNVTFYFYPDEGYMVNCIYVNGVYMGRYLKSFTLTDIWEDTEVVVEFMKVDGANTGDDSSMTGWWIALGVAGSATIATGVMLLLGKRREDEEEENSVTE